MSLFRNVVVTTTNSERKSSPILPTQQIPGNKNEWRMWMDQIKKMGSLLDNLFAKAAALEEGSSKKQMHNNPMPTVSTFIQSEETGISITGSALLQVRVPK